VDVARIRTAMASRQSRFRLLLDDREWLHCTAQSDPAQSVAGVIATKEAVFKAMGTGWGNGYRFRDISISYGPRGNPQLKLAGQTLQRALSLGLAVSGVLSISHLRELAVAVVVFAQPQ
jgi:holo-[acyl-carrier protein] synthase